MCCESSDAAVLLSTLGHEQVKNHRGRTIGAKVGEVRSISVMPHVCPPSVVWVHLSRVACLSPICKAAVRKTRKRVPAKVEYFVNHCENTSCTLSPGHLGLCSHQIVTGKRGGRPYRRRNTPSPFFDLNDSESD